MNISCPKDKAFDICRNSDALFTYDNKSGIVFNGDGRGATVYGTRYSQQATTIGLPFWYGLGSIVENIPQIGLKGIKLAATVPLVTLALVLTPTNAGEGSTVDGYVLNSNDANSNKTADELLPGSLKRSPSYDPRYGGKTRSELDRLAKKGDSRAGKMKKLVDQVDRLLQKNKGKK